jgi:hypothetical protein
MKIEGIKISANLKTAVKEAAIKMLEHKTDSINLKPPFNDFFVSFDHKFKENMFFAFKPEELSIESDAKVYVFLK